VKTETIVLNIAMAIIAILVAGWMIVKKEVVGLQYVEAVEVIHVYAPSDATWQSPTDDVPGRWVDPQTGEPVTHETATPRQTWQVKRNVPRAAATEPNVSVSLWRTFGLWVAALLTLCVFSFLYRDNPFYKAAEALVVGVSAAYYMVVNFWAMIVPNLIGNLDPDFVTRTFSPDFEGERRIVYVVPLILAIMLLWRLSPVGGWIARWPLAFIIGITAGLRLIGFLQADFVAQIQATIMPLIVRDDGSFSFWMSLRNITIILGLLACLTYFFFSIEHKGVVGKTARVGIYVLMITFGAGFAYTVMGRITLLTQRIEFLVNDWLWLIGG
jgi:hypothetical protein